MPSLLWLVAAALFGGAAFVLGAWLGHAASERASGPLRDELEDLAELELELAELSLGRKIPCPTCGPMMVCRTCRARIDAEKRLTAALDRVAEAAVLHARARLRGVRDVAR